jgi:hypothetical protein
MYDAASVEYLHIICSGPSDTIGNHIELNVHLKSLKNSTQLRYSVGIVERRGTNANPLIK